MMIADFQKKTEHAIKPVIKNTTDPLGLEKDNAHAITPIIIAVMKYTVNSPMR